MAQCKNVILVLSSLFSRLSWRDGSDCFAVPASDLSVHKRFFGRPKVVTRNSFCPRMVYFGGLAMKNGKHVVFGQTYW